GPVANTEARRPATATQDATAGRGKPRPYKKIGVPKEIGAPNKIGAPKQIGASVGLAFARGSWELGRGAQQDLPSHI
ncbi:MAG TPA: hypothetical protein VK770_06695, partial [Candidatus Acidoferrum sp.]|nr:hypothetical protein [Candidatus Acidoferrum sp.]